MFDIQEMTDEERFRFGGWFYNMMEGWKDPDWWNKYKDLAEATGHILTVNITAP